MEYLLTHDLCFFSRDHEKLKFTNFSNNSCHLHKENVSIYHNHRFAPSITSSQKNMHLDTDEMKIFPLPEGKIWCLSYSFFYVFLLLLWLRFGQISPWTSCTGTYRSLPRDSSYEYQELISKSNILAFSLEHYQVSFWFISFTMITNTKTIVHTIISIKWSSQFDTMEKHFYIT